MGYQNNPERIMVSDFGDGKAGLGYYPDETLSDTT
jgi:hypothetical protein